MELGFNKAAPLVMHIDLNSCFATVEQQANPLLRGKPVAVAAYDSPGGIILSPSIEAKRFGIKTVMPIGEARMLCPHLIVKTPDSNKYRDVHRKFVEIFRTYSPEMTPKSIDEAVIDFSTVGDYWQTRVDSENKNRSAEGSGWFITKVAGKPYVPKVGPTVTSLGMQDYWLVKIAQEIKIRMKREIGEWMWCNVGIGPSRFLAKMAADLNKPDGLDVITHRNLLEVYESLSLVDLYGINVGYEARLNRYGVFTPLQFIKSTRETLKKQVFKSIGGHYWYLRLRGWEIDGVDFSRKSYGHQYALGKKTDNYRQLCRIVLKLTEKMGRRLRRDGRAATGVHVGCRYADKTYWHRSHKVGIKLSSTRDLYREVKKVFDQQPEKKIVSLLSVSCYGLEEDDKRQLSLWDCELDTLSEKKPSPESASFSAPNKASLFGREERSVYEFEKWRRLGDAMDLVNDRYGEFIVSPALMMNMDDQVLDRIGFGRGGVVD